MSTENRTTLHSTIGFLSEKSALEDLKLNFKSEVYASLDEYMDDLKWHAVNETFHGELAFITESKKPRRSSKERHQILVKKIKAQRKMEIHLESGGTEIVTGTLPNYFKKASH